MQTDQALKAGQLSLPIEMLEHILCLPDGCKIMSVVSSQFERTLTIVLASTDIPGVLEGCPLPQVSLSATVDTLPEHPDYRRVTMEIKLV